MKNILFKKLIDPEKNTKSLLIEQRFEDQECHSYVRKSFYYTAKPTVETQPQVVEPEMYIFKNFDSKKKVEMFSFHVHGNFYVTHQRTLLAISFYHTLDIQIQWKSKLTLPKKPAIIKE